MYPDGGKKPNRGEIHRLIPIRRVYMTRWNETITRHVMRGSSKRATVLFSKYLMEARND